MGTEWPVISEGFQTVSKVLISRKRSNQILFLVIFLVMLCLVPLMVVAGLAAGLNLLLALVGIIIVIALLVLASGWILSYSCVRCLSIRIHCLF